MNQDDAYQVVNVNARLIRQQTMSWLTVPLSISVRAPKQSLTLITRRDFEDETRKCAKYFYPQFDLYAYQFVSVVE